MQINSQNNINFTSIIPVKVYYNGLQATNRTNVMRGYRNAIDTLCGPIRQNSQYRSASEYLSRFDKDYSFYDAWYGFNKDGRMTSTFFDGKGYIFTGEDAEKLKELGHNIGREKKICNETGINESYEHAMAKSAYSDKLKKLINNKSKHIYDLDIKDTGEEVITPLYMRIDLSEPKKGKFQLDNIFFAEI